MTARPSRSTIAITATVCTLIAMIGVLVDSPVRGERGPDQRVDSYPVPQLPDDDRPNFVVVLADDMRADDLQYMPQTRRLLRGTRFNRALSPHPLCCPARAMMVSGQYAQNNGVTYNSGPTGGFPRLRQPDASIAAALHETGYLTALHGKYMNGYLGTMAPQVGWDVWDPLIGRAKYDNFQFYDGDAYTDDYVTSRIAERSEDSIRAFSGPGSPFYLFINHTAPHEHYQGDNRPEGEPSLVPPLSEPQYADRFRDEKHPAAGKKSLLRRTHWSVRGVRTDDRQRAKRLHQGRARSLLSLDDSVASMVETLRTTGELDNTVIVFTSDNGFQLGEHSMIGKNVLAVESLKVPMLWSGPDIVNQRTRKIVSLLDMVATFVDIAGATAPHRLDGVSLRPFLLGREPSRPWRDTTLVQTGSQRMGGKHSGYWARGVMTDRFTYFREPFRGGQITLLDRLEDPDEVRNYWKRPAYRFIRRELNRRLMVLQDCAGPRSCNRDFGPLPPIVRGRR